MDQPHPRALACTWINVSGTRRAHESSDFDKEEPPNYSNGSLRKDMQIVLVKSTKVVWTKVTNKKGKRGKSEAYLIYWPLYSDDSVSLTPFELFLSHFSYIWPILWALSRPLSWHFLETLSIQSIRTFYLIIKSRHFSLWKKNRPFIIQNGTT